MGMGARPEPDHGMAWWAYHGLLQNPQNPPPVARAEAQAAGGRAPQTYLVFIEYNWSRQLETETVHINRTLCSTQTITCQSIGSKRVVDGLSTTVTVTGSIS